MSQSRVYYHRYYICNYAISPRCTSGSYLYFIHFGSGTKNSLSTVRWVRMDRSRLSALLFMFIIAFGKLRKMGQ